MACNCRNQNNQFYKEGYKAGFREAVLYARKHSSEPELVDKLIEEYNNYPCVVEMKIKELDI